MISPDPALNHRIGICVFSTSGGDGSGAYSAASITVPRFWPASGMPKALELASVMERRSSGSMLRTSVLPVQRAMIEASADMALMIEAAPSARSASVRSPKKAMPPGTISPPSAMATVRPMAPALAPSPMSFAMSVPERTPPK